MKNKYRLWIGSKLIKERLARRLYQQQLADKIAIKRATYAAYEEGRAEPSIFTLEKICQVFKITIDQFMSDSPFKSNTQC